MEARVQVVVSLHAALHVAVEPWLPGSLCAPALTLWRGRQVEAKSFSGAGDGVLQNHAVL